MTIRKFLEAHPCAELELFTPDGYILLNRDECQRLFMQNRLEGRFFTDGTHNVKEVESEDLLTQNIIAINTHEGAYWCFSTDHTEESYLSEDADPASRVQARIKDCYMIYRAEQQMMSPFKMFENAREIAATREVYEALKDGTLCKPYLDSLLREDNPLTAVRDRWMAYNDVDLSHEMNAVLLQMEQEQEQSQSPTRESPC